MKRIHQSALTWAASITVVCAQQNHSHNEHHNLAKQLNPELGVVINANLYLEDSAEGMDHIKEELPGFGHGHSHEEHAHGQENGFNLSEVEVYLAGELDRYLRAEATLAFTADEAEIETAFVETTTLPWGLALKGGKFFSNFGILNAQHPHQWDFADQPLIYELTLGDHGLNETGAQITWTLENAPFLLTAGAEALQGQNERLFAHEGEEPLTSHDGPRLGLVWLKAGPDLGHNHNLQFGASYGNGRHQEIHEETEGTNNYLDGMSWFFGADILYQHYAHGDQGQGDVTLQAEYFYRNKDLELDSSDDPGAPLGSHLDAAQDGYYAQALYGILPRWRAGLRWEQIGLTNETTEPGEDKETYAESWKASAMLAFSPSPQSLIRLQTSNGEYHTEDGVENVWETYLQLVVSLGNHRHQNGHICSGTH